MGREELGRHCINSPFSFQGKLTPEEQQDESVNRIASFLQTLATVAKASVVCQRKVFMAFCLLVNERRIDISLVKKVRFGKRCGLDFLTAALRHNHNPRQLELHFQLWLFTLLLVYIFENSCMLKKYNFNSSIQPPTNCQTDEV